MIRHEVIVRVRSEVSGEIVEQTTLDAARLLGEVPGVERVRYGYSKSPANRHMMFVVDLIDGALVDEPEPDATEERRDASAYEHVAPA